MDIHRIYEIISPKFRKKRFSKFLSYISPTHNDRILDIGGLPETWTTHQPLAKEVNLINIYQIEFEPKDYPKHNIKILIGNGCDLEMPDQSYDIVYSNSVIEHVGTWSNQVKFAAEARRVGKFLWIQTPAKEFFLEPHYIAPFIHWLPKSLRKRLIRFFTIWGFLNKPSKREIEQSVNEIRLLSYSEMQKVFPDCEILKERFLLIFVKSYIAFRNWSVNIL